MRPSDLMRPRPSLETQRPTNTTQQLEARCRKQRQRHCVSGVAQVLIVAFIMLSHDTTPIGRAGEVERGA